MSLQLAATPAEALSTSSMARLQTLVELLLGPLGLSAVYLLVDGVDGFPETADSPAAITLLLAPLLSNIRRWAESGIFLKCFLPTETAKPLTKAIPQLRRLTHQVTITWSTQLLAEVLRQRIYVATAGAFGSLDAISTPSLRDTETQLAQIIRPLPREMLVLTNRLIWEHIHRSGPTGQLDENDLRFALEWYESQRSERWSIGLVSQ